METPASKVACHHCRHSWYVSCFAVVPFTCSRLGCTVFLTRFVAPFGITCFTVTRLRALAIANIG